MATKDSTPRYRVKEVSVIDNQVHPVGSEIEYDGLPSSNLEPLNEAAEAKAAEYEESNKARVATLMATTKDEGIFDSKTIIAQLAAENAKQISAMTDAITAAVTAALANGQAGATVGNETALPAAAPADDITATDTAATDDTTATTKSKRTKAATTDSTATDAVVSGTVTSAAPEGTTDSADA